MVSDTVITVVWSITVVLDSRRVCQRVEITNDFIPSSLGDVYDTRHAPCTIRVQDASRKKKTRQFHFDMCCIFTYRSIVVRYLLVTPLPVCIPRENSFRTYSGEDVQNTSRPRLYCDINAVTRTFFKIFVSCRPVLRVPL